MTRLIVRPAAEADILDAQMWYSARDGALAGRFIDELRSTLSRVRVSPDDESAIVVAVLHQSRAAVAWKRRIGSEREG